MSECKIAAKLLGPRPEAATRKYTKLVDVAIMVVAIALCYPALDERGSSNAPSLWVGEESRILRLSFET